MSVADVDGDGDLDLVVGNHGFALPAGLTRLYLNDGSGRFSDVTGSRMPQVSFRTQSLALADLDGDGKLDVLLGCKGQDGLLLGDGRGRFTDHTPGNLPADRDGSRAVAAGDLDGDGMLDLLFANSGQSRLYLGDGRGGFSDATAGRLPSRDELTQHVLLVDTDADGDLDLVLANHGQNRLLLNDRSGRFADAAAGEFPADIDITMSLVAGDIDEDGDVDLVPCNWQAFTTKVYLNDGHGRFAVADPRRRAYPGDWAWAMAMSDLDRDGDLDLVVARHEMLGFYAHTEVFIENNLLRQVHAPYRPRPGHVYELRSYSSGGFSNLAVPVLPWIGLAPLQRWVAIPPLGWLGLDPTLAWDLPVHYALPPDGVAVLRFPLPADKSLKGQAFYLQSLFVHGRPIVSTRLGNLHVERIH